jgi:hypothetical protein
MNLEKLVETIIYNDVVFEVVERPEILWVGKIAYASNNTDEPDIGKLLNEYRALVPVEKLELINPDWSAAISIDYWQGEAAPCGMMFGQETYSDKQDERYDLYKIPASLFIRVQNNAEAAKFFGRDIQGTWELFGVIKEQVMPKYGYKFNENGAQEIEYANHKDGIQYAYVPVIKR